MIQIFTNPAQECTAQNVPFTINEEIMPPELGGYEVIVLLYRGVPGKDDPVVLEDYEKVLVKEGAALVDINPNTINLKRRGQFISAKIRMTEGFDLETIIPESFKLYLVKENNELTEGLPAQRVMIDMFDNGLNVKFSNQAVLNLIKATVSEFPASVKFLVQWQLTGDDTIYEGTDAVRVINPGKSKDKNKEGDKGKGNRGKDKNED
jgi:hypothetical protein